MPYLQWLIWLVHMTGMQKTQVQTLAEPRCPSFSMVLNFFTGHPHACLHLPNVQIGYTIRDGGMFVRKTLAIGL